jgi:hypothetical protein
MSDVPEKQEKPPSSSSKNSLWIGVGVGVGVLIVIGIVSWFVRRSKHMQPSSKGFINDENINNLLKSRDVSQTLKDLLKQ